MARLSCEGGGPGRQLSAAACPGAAVRRRAPPGAAPRRARPLLGLLDVGVAVDGERHREVGLVQLAPEAGQAAHAADAGPRHGAGWAAGSARPLRCAPSRPAYIQACRALMIISIVLGLLATVLSLFGLKCTQVGMSNENTKVKISVTGGAIFILAGLSSMVAVSWYAARITAQFFDPLYGGTKYELGDALYLGWAGSILSMLGGIFLTCSCKGGKRGKHSDRKYDYSAGQAAHQPRIYTKNSDTVRTAKDYV
uniref:Claudin-15 n=1 Tax=Chrysemys picta bellii TaxID=8478 RepID=A0A8C3I4R8_CHRPI